MLIFGKVVDVYQGREYQGKVPDVVQILDLTGTGRKSMLDITLHPTAVKEVRALIDHDVLLTFTEINGRGQSGSYTLRVDGSIASSDLVDRLIGAESALVK